MQHSNDSPHCRSFIAGVFDRKGMYVYMHASTVRVDLRVGWLAGL